MIVIKIDEEMTPKLKEAVIELMGQFNIVSFGVEAKPTAPQVRSGNTGKDLGAALSAATDRVQSAKRNS